MRKESNMVKNGDSSVKDDFQAPCWCNVLLVGLEEGKMGKTPKYPIQQLLHLVDKKASVFMYAFWGRMKSQSVLNTIVLVKFLCVFIITYQGFRTNITPFVACNIYHSTIV